MHQDNLLAVLVLGVASLLPFACAGTRELVDPDFLIGSSSGSSRIIDNPDDFELFEDEEPDYTSWVRCTGGLPREQSFWPVGYEAYMFGNSPVRLCAWHGDAISNMHLRCIYSDAGYRLGVTPNNPSRVEFIRDAILLTYCLMHCRCNIAVAQSSAATTAWRNILPRWVANANDGLVLAHEEDSGSLTFTTLIAPTLAGGSEPSEATSEPQAEIEEAEEALGESNNRPALLDSWDGEPGDDDIGLGRPSWLDEASGSREGVELKQWWELSDAELLERFPPGAEIPPSIEGLVERLRARASRAVEESSSPVYQDIEYEGTSEDSSFELGSTTSDSIVPIIGAGSIGYQSEWEQSEGESGGGEPDVGEPSGGEIQPDLGNWPIHFNPSDEYYITAQDRLGWVFVRGFIVGIYRLNAKGNRQIVYLSPQRASTIDIPRDEDFPPDDSASSSSSSTTTQTTTQPSSPPPPPPPYRYVRNKRLPGIQGTLETEGFIYGTWHQEGSLIYKRVYNNPRWKGRPIGGGSGNGGNNCPASSQGSCILKPKFVGVNANLPKPGSRVRPQDGPEPTSNALPLLIRKQHHRPNPVRDALKCGTSCSSFAGCGDACRCLAKPGVQHAGEFLWLGVCAGWNGALQAISAAAGAGGDGVGKGGLGGKVKKMRKRGLFMKRDLDGFGDGAATVCPCNASYVSVSCCEVESGLVWEGPEMKLGVLTFEDTNELR